MRVTETSMYANMSRRAGASRGRVAEASEPLLTGRKATKPSEDPFHAQRLVRTERALRRNDQLRSSVGRLETYYQVAETSVQNAVDVLSEMKTLALSMANDTNGADQRAMAASQVEQLAQSLQALGNTKFQGRYVFGGTAQDTPPYGEDRVFAGDAVGRTVEIGEGVTIKADLTGPSVFGNEGQSAFDAAQALADALLANDEDGIQQAIAAVGAAHDTAVGALVDTGFRMQHLARTDDINEDQEYVHEVNKAKMDEADIASAASEVAYAETVYQAALQTAAKLNHILSSQVQL